MSREQNDETGLSRLLGEFARQKQEYESTTVKCGFVGRSGVGKSSLINAITGEKLAPVGFAKETTIEPHEYLHRGLVLVDLPGCGTERFPTEEYVQQLSLESYDLFIFVTELRFFQDDKVVYSQLVNELKKPCFLVRNKFDLALADAAYDGHNLSAAECKEAIERNVKENLAPVEVKKVYMVSARQPSHHDLPDLLNDIQDSFAGMKKLRLENDLAAWSQVALLKKRENAMRITAWYAGMAALNGLNPVLGLDVSVDLGILRRLSREVAEIYSLTQEQEEYWRSVLKGADGRALLQKMVALTLKYGTETAIATLLKALGKRELPKVFSKFIPFAGQALACAAGAGITYSFGKGLVDEYHDIATKILADLNS